MAERKNNKNTKNTKASAKKQSGRRTADKQQELDIRDGLLYQCLPFLLIVLGILLELCLIIPDQLGLMGSVVSSLLFGLFASPAYLLPVLLLVVALYLRSIDRSITVKAILATVCLVSVCTLLDVFSPHAPTSNLSVLWQDGNSNIGGGAVGGIVCWLLMGLAQKVGTVIISSAVLVLCALLLFDFTPHNVWVYTRYQLKKRREAARAAREEAPAQRFRYRIREPEEYDTPDEEKVDPKNAKRVIEENERIIAAMGGEGDSTEETDGEEPEVPVVGRIGEEESGELDLDRIFSDEPYERQIDIPDIPEEEEPELRREPVAEPEEEKEVRDYVLPPVSLLKDPGKRSADAGEEEAKTNAIKLVKTLASFKVNTRIANISRGPTITRYELVPEEGVRVRSVANLVDDISLSLATEGVRIEAPIPGKSAIGIEVPNKAVETVYLRELIDTEEFRTSKSKLTAVLGMDVAGAPRFFDIVKMPHLLIAGATGMGKSVCINSIITSLLYRATPDEVKLILIDPKKVELNIYNGLPHLLVPVVSHPKKAAGTLNWACIEMERRFELIEDVGVRDIGGYNDAVKDDPDREYLPQIVIIIDELADLMMTAPDDVENSICRLAQKARAAGMHLIIGTQRPSVDVITGLIKANIPSRIAFTVASQVDSRTILDIAGAEKLIGRGDMLFAPVGCTKPIRVQGSFVSDSEVDAVVEFIKRQSGKVDYDQSVVATIEKEAERCGAGKKGGGSDGGDAGEDDPRLMEALEVAVDSGKVSTSLLQRRMSIGYGKAAKLIDQLEAKGWVGPLDGAKPREIRISKQQFMEMALNKKQEDDE